MERACAGAGVEREKEYGRHLGISGPTFLMIYSGLLAVTTLVVLITRRRRLAGPGAPAGEPTLDTYDLAMLNGGEALTVAMAIANLREAGAVTVPPDPQRATAAQTKAHDAGELNGVALGGLGGTIALLGLGGCGARTPNSPMRSAYDARRRASRAVGMSAGARAETEVAAAAAVAAAAVAVAAAAAAVAAAADEVISARRSARSRYRLASAAGRVHGAAL